MTNREPHPCDGLAQLSAHAVAQARARKARALDEAELERACGGIRVLEPIIWGFITPDEPLQQSALSVLQTKTIVGA